MYAPKRKSMYASRPSIATKRSGRTVEVHVSHREFVQDITIDNGAFTLLPQEGYAINPGNPFTFPWLSTIAGQFTSYKCHAGSFDFVSTYGVAIGGPGAITSGTTTLVSPGNASLGSVSMAVQYDTILPAWKTKTAMLSDTGSTSGRPSENQHIRWQVDKSNLVLDTLYVRTGNVPKNADQRLYDIGTLYLAADGMQIPFYVLDDVPIPIPMKIGELWVNYSFTFYKPMISSDPDPIPDPYVPTAATAYVVIDQKGIGWGGTNNTTATSTLGSQGCWGPIHTSGTQTLDEGVCVYPTDADETPNQQMLDTMAFPTFTNDTMTLYSEDGATQGKQRVYSIETSWNFGTFIGSGIGLGAFNYQSPRIPSDPVMGNLGDDIWELNNIFVASSSLNDVAQGPNDGNQVAVKRWRWRIVCWLIDPTRGGTLKCKFIAPTNRVFPPADETASAGPYAAYNCSVGVATDLLPTDLSIALYGGPLQLASPLGPKKKVFEKLLE